jgi:transposase
VTNQSGKKKVVRRSINLRLRKALYQWARASIVSDQKCKSIYAEMRARGDSDGRALRGIADRRRLAILNSMLR